jgi:hypothetical protein
VRKKLAGTAILFFVAWLPACATVTGAVVGPVAFPVSDIRHTSGVPWWGRVFTVPFGIVFGPVYGAAQGASADFGYLTHGAYGEARRPEFGIVFDPLNNEPESWDDVTEPRSNEIPPP